MIQSIEEYLKKQNKLDSVPKESFTALHNKGTIVHKEFDYLTSVGVCISAQMHCVNWHTAVQYNANILYVTGFA